MNKDNLLTTRMGRQLYELLPEVYRTRDTGSADDTGDLARFLDACGHLLDLIRHTLDQRLADAFPDNPPDGPACQPWLLPYFADLLDVRMVSPDESGRRDEVANAVAWRQRKGTLKVLEQIAENVGRFETEIQEGWKRVATTPQIGLPRLPAPALGESEQHDKCSNHPNWAARHPGLPAVMVDLRYPTRALQVETVGDVPPQNPAAKLTTFAGQPVWWRQVNRHGAPCFPGSYEDVSRRTADVRTPNWAQGHAHPKRALLHVPPPLGFFGPDPYTSVTDLSFTKDGEHLLQDHCVTGTLQVSAGRLTLRRCMVKNLEVTVSSPNEFVLRAENCLFDRAAVPNGPARLEYCTVLTQWSSHSLQASDMIFVNVLTLDPGTETNPHCIRFSRIPNGLTVDHLRTFGNTTESPIFYECEFDERGQVVRRCPVFGEPGCATLHPATAEAIRFGAEDGGEMGAYHDRRYSLLLAAVQDKLNDFLPVGMEAVIIPDLRLHRLPREACIE